MCNLETDGEFFMRKATKSKYLNQFWLGQKFQEWEVVDNAIYFDDKSRAHVKCRCSCGTEDSVNCHNLVNGSSTRCVKCGLSYESRSFSNNPNWKGEGQIPKTILTTIAASAEQRNIPYSITSTQANALFNGTCTVTGQSISAENGTAKLIAFNNNLGYSPDNVAWVHNSVASVVNKFESKQKFDEFINMCVNVAKQHQFKKE